MTMIPDENSLSCYCEAGKIASVILKKGSSLIEIGNRVLETVESIEQMVEEQGCGLAFPLNLSFNEDAAHDTASADEQRVFSEGDVVKLDLGVHLEGYIADTAVTVDLGDNALLIEASKAALSKAIEIVRPGVHPETLEGRSSMKSKCGDIIPFPISQVTALPDTRSIPPRAFQTSRFRAGLCWRRVWCLPSNLLPVQAQAGSARRNALRSFSRQQSNQYACLPPVNCSNRYETVMECLLHGAG